MVAVGAGILTTSLYGYSLHCKVNGRKSSGTRQTRAAPRLHYDTQGPHTACCEEQPSHPLLMSRISLVLQECNRERIESFKCIKARPRTHVSRQHCAMHILQQWSSCMERGVPRGHKTIGKPAGFVSFFHSSKDFPHKIPPLQSWSLLIRMHAQLVTHEHSETTQSHSCAKSQSKPWSKHPACRHKAPFFSLQNVNRQLIREPTDKSSAHPSQAGLRKGKCFIGVMRICASGLPLPYTERLFLHCDFKSF